MASSEAMLAYEYLKTVLSGDTTLTSYAPGGVWRNEAPPVGTNSSTPYIILSYQSGQDVVTAYGTRIFASLKMQVKVVGPASQAASNIVPAASRIDALIGLVRGAPLTTDGNGLVLTCYAEQPIALDELINGELWLSVGAMYRMQIQAIG